MASQFLFNEAIWTELTHRVPTAHKVQAAVAYIGSGGSDLLPLRDGDSLVVDMSLGTVRAGSTDPKEIRKFLERGVDVFSRTSLHAKFFLIDRVLIAGSANLSRNAKTYLDEAAILTTDPAAVRRARATYQSLCTEPVRERYLEKCLAEYRPPSRSTTGQARRRPRSAQAKLWIVGGLRYTELAESEQSAAEEAVQSATDKLREERSEVNYIHHPAKERYLTQLREGDWVISCIKHGRGYDVWSPQRFLGIESTPRGRGKRLYLVLLEQPIDSEPTRWTRLRTAASFSLPKIPRTRAILDTARADELLRLWDNKGRFRPRKKGR